SACRTAVNAAWALGQSPAAIAWNPAPIPLSGAVGIPHRTRPGRLNRSNAARTHPPGTCAPAVPVHAAARESQVKMSEGPTRVADVGETRPRLLLLDGHSLAYRAFFALPVDKFSTKTGQPTNAVFGFTSMLINVLRDEKPTHIAVAFDVSRKSFRNER